MDQKESNEPSKPNSNADQPETINVPVSAASPVQSRFAQVERITAMILMTSGVLFAIIGIAAIWGAFDDNGEIVWRSLGSLAVIALAALVINVGVRMAEGRK